MNVLQMDAHYAQRAAQRVIQRCDQLAAISEVADQITRVYLSEQHLQCNKLVAQWMESAGMRVWQDQVGNLCGRYEGILGVLSAIELVAWLSVQQRRLPHALEVVGFADEEGTRFGITLLGSRALTGGWPAHWLSVEDSAGISVQQALLQTGFDPQMIGGAARDVAEIAAYLELHIEQGPCLEAADLALGVVTAINGARRLNCRFTGKAGHAGTVPMTQRHDALAATAEWITWLEQQMQQGTQQQVATVGALQCFPGAVNVIPGDVAFSLDIRGPQDAPLDKLQQQLLLQAQQIAARRGLVFCAEEYYRIPATPCDSRLQLQLRQAVCQVQQGVMSLPSGAGHDAIAIAECWPVGMLFVRCRGGISHHPDEWVSAEDVALALQALSRVVEEI